MVDEVRFAEITDGCPQGEGVFDQLMKSVKAHLLEEYDAQRIRGSEYTQVYLNSLSQAMGQSIQWQLGAQIAENQALLIEKQIENVEKQNLLLEEQRQLLIAQTAQTNQQTTNLDLEANNIPKQGDILDAQEDQLVRSTETIIKSLEIGGLLDKQLEQVVAQTSNIEQQGTNLEAEALNIPKQGDILDAQEEQLIRSTEVILKSLEVGGLLDKQVEQIVTQTANIEQQGTNLGLEANNIPKQGDILEAQEEQLIRSTEVITRSLEVDGLLDKQLEQVVTQTSVTAQQGTNLVAEALNIPKQGDILDAQELQIGKSTELTTEQILQVQDSILTSTYNRDNTMPAQVAILDQKLVTEQAQTMDSTPLQGAVEGVIGKQKVLYTKQADGFTRDAEQKASRILSDIWGISVSADVGGGVTPLNVGQTEMDLMLDKLKAEAGLP